MTHPTKLGDRAKKEMDALLNVVRVWIETGIGPSMMTIGLPCLGVQIKFKGKRLTIEAGRGE